MALLGASLFWGCSQSREIIYPGRKVSPPRVIKAKPPRLSRSRPVAPIEEGPKTESNIQPDAPTSIDVPIIDRNGR